MQNAALRDLKYINCLSVTATAAAAAVDRVGKWPN